MQEAPPRQYFEQMPCYLSIHDREYRIVDGNRRFREDFGDRVGDFCYQVYKRRTEVCPDCPVHKTFATARATAPSSS
jgi:PAS domain-containing protein